MTAKDEICEFCNFWKIWSLNKRSKLKCFQNEIEQKEIVCVARSWWQQKHEWKEVDLDREFHRRNVAIPNPYQNSNPGHFEQKLDGLVFSVTDL